MPELNWENREVRAAIYDVMRYWLGLGVDGFRVDVILRLAKDREFKDEPPNPAYRPGVDPEYNTLLHTHTRDVEHVHEYVREIRQVVDEYEDRVLIGETYLPVQALLRYYGNRDEAHLPFNFGLITEPFETEAIMDYIEEYLAALPSWAWPNWVLGNHDTGRIAAEERAGGDRAAAAAILLCTLPGTITLYYGDELGMVNGEFTLAEMKDNLGRNNVGTALSRDRGRTPMQWDAGRNGGFSRGEPWLRVNPDAGERNVAAACADGDALLSLYRRLIAFRRFRPEVVGGSVRLVSDVERVIGYEVGIPRAEGMPWLVEDSESMGWTVLLNISDETVALSRHEGRRVELASEVALERLPFSGTLAPGQAVVLSSF
jgi:alpha-glucosidase